MSYISVVLDGRLGNNLFQISCLMDYCKKYNENPLIHNWKYSKYFKNLPEHLSDIPKSDFVYIEPAFSYNEIPFFSGSVELRGFFQSHLYHENIDVNHLFELKDEYKKQVDDLYSKINPSGKHSLAVHVRRSDYLNPGTKEYHGVMDMNYYIKSFSEMVGHLGKEYVNDRFVILYFSDDIEWCKENFNGIIDNQHFIEGNEDIIDLFLMSKCQFIITANSSFSYWGAYLGFHKGKKVIMPKAWFAGAPQNNTKDLYLPNAIII